MLLVELQEEQFDGAKEEFFWKTHAVVELEHSLVSISKWESKWEVPYLAKEEKTDEQAYSYIECMIEDPGFDKDLLQYLTEENVQEIAKYIQAKMTATWFAESKTPGAPPRKEVITAEIIYYWMIALNVPMECQHWHLNKLLTLIEVCSRKNASAGNKKPSRPTGDALAQRRALNAQRRAAAQSSG